MKKAEMGPSDDKDFFTFSMHLGSRWSCARKPYCSLAVTGHAMKFVSEIDYLSENIFVAHYSFIVLHLVVYMKRETISICKKVQIFY